MAKGNSRLGSKSFFTMTVLAVSALGLIVITGAALKPTNTQSDASGCTHDPVLSFEGSTGYKNSTIYHLKLKNNCTNDKRFKLSVIETPTQPRKIDGWHWGFKGGTGTDDTYIKPSFSGSSNVDLTVIRPGGVNLAKTPAGKYSWVVVRASVYNQPEISDTLRLYYNVEN